MFQRLPKLLRSQQFSWRQQQPAPSSTQETDVLLDKYAPALGETANEQKLSQEAMKAAQGFSGGEIDRMRAAITGNVQGAMQGNLRALRGAQAASGVRGGVAAGQQAAVRAQGAQDLAGAEAGLMQATNAAKLQGLQTGSSIVTNIANTQRDLASDRLSFALGMRAQDKGVEAARLARSRGGGKGGGK